MPPAVKNAWPVEEMTQMRALRLARGALNLNGSRTNETGRPAV